LPGVCAGGGALEQPAGGAVKLPLPEHFRWLLLRRVKSGAVANSGQDWLRHGSPMNPFLVEFYKDLREAGLIEMGDPAPQDGVSAVTLTDAGQARYSELCRKQRRKDDPGSGAR